LVISKKNHIFAKGNQNYKQMFTIIMIVFFVVCVFIAAREIKNAVLVDPKEPFLWDDYVEKEDEIVP